MWRQVGQASKQADRVVMGKLEEAMDTLGIIREIETDPGLRAQLRAVLLGDEVLSMPAQLAALAESQRHMIERQDRMEEALAALAESQREMQAAMAEMQAAIAGIVERQDRMDTRLQRLETDVGHLKGSDLERRVRERLPLYLPDGLEKVQLLDGQALRALIAELDQKARLERPERQRLVQTDVLAFARMGAARVTVVGEVSATLHAEDVARAAETARILNERGLRASAFAIGNELGSDVVASVAAERGVEMVVGI